MIWIYEAFPHLGEFAGKSMDEPFSIPRILRWHTTKRDKIIECDPFKYKEEVIENMHSYIIPTARETKMDYMITFDSYTGEVNNNILNGLNKELEGVTILTSNEDSDDDGNSGSNPVRVRVGDDDSPSTSKDTAGTSSLGDLHKCVAALEEAVRETKKEKKEQNGQLASIMAEEEKEEKKDEEEEMEEDKIQEEGGKVATTEVEEEVRTDEQEDGEKEKADEEEADKEEVEKEAAEEGVEEKETKEAPAAADAEKEGEEGENKEAAAAVEKKGAEVDQKDVVMDIVDEINSNTCVDEELREKDI
ncbi:hypothetical protein P3S68_000985 [Capsicum galapagoense]